MFSCWRDKWGNVLLLKLLGKELMVENCGKNLVKNL
jgi:hypothetical protein